MNRKSLVLLLVLGLLVPLFAGAATFRAGEQLNLGQDLSITGNLYGAGGNVTSAAQILGDLLLAGGNLFVTGSTTEDAMLAGGLVNVSGTVGEDLRAAGGNLILSGNVGGDAVLAGGQVSLLPGVQVGGDLGVAGGQVSMGGAVTGSANLVGGQINVNGTIVGDTVIRAEKIVIGEDAVINGQLTYYSPVEAEIAEGAVLAGGVQFEMVERSPRQAVATAGAISVAWLFYKFLALFILGWLLHLLSGMVAGRLVVEAAERFWPRLGLGLLILIVAPILAVILFITVLGIPFGLITLLAYILLLVLSYLFMPIFLGSWLWKVLRRDAVYQVDWKTILVGALFVTLLSAIPVIGWLAQLVLFLLGLGAIAAFFYRQMALWRTQGL